MAKTQTKETGEITSPQETFETLFETGLPVKSAYLHQAIQVSGIPAERTLNKTKMPSSEMSLTEVGLLIRHKGKLFGIPLANIANWEV
jgi:hypothetical protein